MKAEVAIPCYNEEQTVAKVIRDFRTALPDAEIVVYDNASDDRTADVARQAGARVVRVNRRGKGYVLQAVFELSDADVLVIVDGDDTYEAADVLALTAPILADQADMTIGTRLHTTGSEFRRLHHFGNRALTLVLNAMFGTAYTDILSGYRAFSPQFRQTVPLIGTGFEIETELMIQALSSGMVVREVPIRFRQRPPGSTSKLSSFKDGYRILLAMVVLLRDHRPLFTFSLAGTACFILGGSLWLFAVLTQRTGGPFSVQAAGVVFMQLAAGLVLGGFILNTINTRMRELGSLLRRRRS
jgi:glycosyltransferase involved in cell wall biosynthesis